MALYFFVLIAFAGMRFFRARFSHPHIDEVERSADRSAAQTQAAAFWSRKDISLKDIAMNIAFAVAVVWVSNLIAGLFSPLAAEGVVTTLQEGLLDFVGKFLGSQYVWITTLSVITATFFAPVTEQLHGSQEIGTYLIYLFLFVIGVPANIYTVLTQAPLFLVLTFLMVVVNMLFCFIGARMLKFDLEDAIIASIPSPVASSSSGTSSFTSPDSIYICQSVLSAAASFLPYFMTLFTIPAYRPDALYTMLHTRFIACVHTEIVVLRIEICFVRTLFTFVSYALPESHCFWASSHTFTSAPSARFTIETVVLTSVFKCPDSTALNIGSNSFAVGNDSDFLMLDVLLRPASSSMTFNICSMVSHDLPTIS